MTLGASDPLDSFFPHNFVWTCAAGQYGPLCVCRLVCILKVKLCVYDECECLGGCVH